MIKKWYLGITQDIQNAQKVYLEDFECACDWYWAGGYIGNNNFLCHFDGCFLEVPDIRGHPLGNFVTPWTKLEDWQRKTAKIIRNGCSIWEPLSFFLDDAQYSEKEWWRIKDLFKQFYILQKAAEVFQYGGHCTTDKRNPLEINIEKAGLINSHIANVIIPETRKALEKLNET